MSTSNVACSDKSWPCQVIPPSVVRMTRVGKLGSLVPDAYTTDSLTIDKPHTKGGARSGRFCTCVHVVPPSEVSNSCLPGVVVPTQPRDSDANPTERKYRPDSS